VGFTQDEWDALLAKFPPGTPVSGVVSSCQVFGVFVRLDELPDVSALLEIIYFKTRETEPERISDLKFPDDYPPVGERIEARILGWCLRPKDVRLTQLSHLDWSHGHWLATRES
jgi:ribosomal protein S1